MIFYLHFTFKINSIFIFLSDRYEIERFEEDPEILGFDMCFNIETGQIFITKVIAQGWAEAQGDLDVGDEIEKINDKAIANMALIEMLEVINNRSFIDLIKIIYLLFF